MVKNFFLLAVAVILVLAFGIIAFVLNVVRKLFRRESLSDYVLIVAISFDQLGGSIIYAQEDWTVSSWTFYLARKGNRSAYYFMRFIDFFFGKRHCVNSYFTEIDKLSKHKEVTQWSLG